MARRGRPGARTRGWRRSGSSCSGGRRSRPSSGRSRPGSVPHPADRICTCNERHHDRPDDLERPGRAPGRRSRWSTAASRTSGWPGRIEGSIHMPAQHDPRGRDRRARPREDDGRRLPLGQPQRARHPDAAGPRVRRPQPRARPRGVGRPGPSAHHARAASPATSPDASPVRASLSSTHGRRRGRPPSARGRARSRRGALRSARAPPLRARRLDGRGRLRARRVPPDARRHRRLRARRRRARAAGRPPRFGDGARGRVHADRATPSWSSRRR